MKRVLSVALVAILALAAGVHADGADEASGSGKITPSPALAEAIANGEMSSGTDFTAKPVEVNGAVFDSGSNESASASASPSTTTPAPATTSPAPSTSSAPSTGGETAVDTFQSTKGISNSSSKMGTGSMILIACAAVGSVGAIMVAVMFKRQAKNTQDDDDDDHQHQQEREQQRRTTTCVFETADYTPGKPSMDGMLQDDRVSTGSSTAMMPVFSVEDRMDVKSGIMRLSSPFGASGVRISSPGRGGVVSTTVNMEFSVGPSSQRGGSGLSFSARSIDASTTSTDTIVHIKPATTSAEI
ncbi:hypothetical protein Gpo141_00007696 [Globisporangium polare]